MKIKSKRNFEVWYPYMKPFSENLEILAPCCDLVILKFKSQISITGGKNIKIRNYNNFG